MQAFVIKASVKYHPTIARVLTAKIHRRDAANRQAK
jgi:hypothetical protein